MTAPSEPGTAASSSVAPGVPDISDVAGCWVEASDLAHLPSLRNQFGQGHVNSDLSSLSWLAAAPYAFGYHTGVLRLDGTILPAQRYRWKPWGVQREHAGPELTVRTDARMLLEQDALAWQIELTNRSAAPVSCTLAQDLFAMVAHSDTGWGWLYDVPWTAGNYHDFMTLERIRSGVLQGPRPAYLIAPGSRKLRLGRPRLPGIQRDSANEPMSLAYELPRHVSQDTVYPYRDSASATVRDIRCRDRGQDTPVILASAEIILQASSEVTVGNFELRAGQLLELGIRVDAIDHDGIILTHGNHPDSLQLGVDSGRLWLAISGEKEYCSRDIVPGRWYGITVALDTGRAVLYIDGDRAAETTHWSASPRWKPLSDGTTVTISDTCSPARACYAFEVTPDSLETTGAGARAEWTLRIEPGQILSLGILCAYGGDDLESEAAVRAAGALGAELARSESGYRDLWHSMFTPGNPHFSGHLPTLRASDEGLSRSYYMAALLVLYMRNTRVSRPEPVFLTGGPRLGPTTTFFWDHTEWSRLYALLEPAGMRSWLLRALATPRDRAFGFDTKQGGPLGNHYASNDYALFRLVEHYVCVTGDLQLLDEQAGPVTVLDHLSRLANGWKARQTAAAGDGVLADFGSDPWQLLECVPNYVNVVASFNAAYAGMTRSFSALLRMLGRPEAAAAAAADADALARAVLGMSLPGGRWQIRHPGRVESIGHCLDFGLVAAYLHGDLSADQRSEAARFVSEKLLTATWMRALAADDPAASVSNRPDHGSAGAFGAWPGVTAYGLAKLGRKDLAAQLLRVVHESSSGGLWGQAMEIVRDERGEWARVAEDGVSNRDSIAGAAIAEAIVSGLFGFDPSFRDMVAPALPDSIEVPGIGSLTGINVGPRGTFNPASGEPEDTPCPPARSGPERGNERP